ncbi:hypothetical protein HY480_03055, partial [Candidatus Uhrbacteria bacterium]|nr:hypothetical protein [Candidatus Uhrbacteria bacterium]
MRANTVVPAIIAKTEAEFVEKFRVMERVAPIVHIDVMDEKFVPNTTWGDPLVVEKLKTPAKLEIHLMVEEPFREVILWGKLKNVERIIVHVESTRQLRELLHTIRATGKEAGLAVNPETSLRTILPFLSSSRAKRSAAERSPEISPLRSHRARSGRNDELGVDFLLVMSNDPGFSGRPFRRATLK